MASPYGIRALIRRTFGRRFALARLTSRQHWFERLIDRLLFDGDDLMILPRDRAVAVNRPLSPREDLAVPSQVLEIFIERAAYHWRMDFCICREASGCRSYPEDLGCLFLGAAASDINPKFGHRVTRREARDHARRCRELGLVHLIGRNKLDRVWLNAGPAHRLLTVCNCCSCCCLWKVLPELSPVIGNKLTRMPGVTVRVGAACNGCGACTREVCFVNAIQLVNGRARIGPTCRGCGRCLALCPSGAIAMTIDDPAYVAATVRRIAKAVDVS